MMENQDAFQEICTEQIINDGQDKITKFYKKRHGRMYKLKSKNDETKDRDVLFNIVQSHANDLKNRYALINYFIRNNIQNPNGCKDMSQEKCSRGENTNRRICRWIPGADELAQWGVTKDTAWNTREKNPMIYLNILVQIFNKNHEVVILLAR